MKPHEEILNNLSKLKDESYIKEILIIYNLWGIFSSIYAIDKEVQGFGSSCTSFIILAYSNGCKWMDYRKDRRTVKTEVLNSVLEYSNIKVDDTWMVWLSKIIDGEIEVVEKAIYDFVDWQKDGKFSTFIALSTQISLCRRMASNTFGVTEKMLNDRGKFLSDLPQLERNLEDLINEIEKKFLNLDESLSKEGKLPISKRTDALTWEQRVAMQEKP